MKPITDAQSSRLGAVAMFPDGVWVWEDTTSRSLVKRGLLAENKREMRVKTQAGTRIDFASASLVQITPAGAEALAKWEAGRLPPEVQP